jgi:hypothetical protein
MPRAQVRYNGDGFGARRTRNGPLMRQFPEGTCTMRMDTPFEGRLHTAFQLLPVPRGRVSPGASTAAPTDTEGE